MPVPRPGFPHSRTHTHTCNASAPQVFEALLEVVVEVSLADLFLRHAARRRRRHLMHPCVFSRVTLSAGRDKGAGCQEGVYLRRLRRLSGWEGGASAGRRSQDAGAAFACAEFVVRPTARDTAGAHKTGRRASHLIIEVDADFGKHLPHDLVDLRLFVVSL